jgi:hypothetical protein
MLDRVLACWAEMHDQNIVCDCMHDRSRFVGSAYRGMPACKANSASIMEAPGSFSEGFSRNVLPAVHATGKIHRGTIAGKLKGAMPAHTCSIRTFNSISVN